eukprot:gene29749-37097_t
MSDPSMILNAEPLFEGDRADLGRRASNEPRHIACDGVVYVVVHVAAGCSEQITCDSVVYVVVHVAARGVPAQNAQLELHGNAIDPSSSVQIQQLADNGGDKRVVARPPARSAPQPLVPHSYMLVNTPPGPAYTVPHAPEHAIQLLEENPLTLGQMAREKRMKSGGAQRRQGSVSQGASQNTNDSKLISVENGYRLSEEVMAERFAALATQGKGGKHGPRGGDNVDSSLSQQCEDMASDEVSADKAGQG